MSTRAILRKGDKMKKLKLFAISLLAMLVAVTGVSAQKGTEFNVTNPLSSALTITQDENAVKVGDYTIDRVHVVVKVTKDNVNTILGQTSGEGSSLGLFYFGLKPQTVTGEKVNMEYSQVKSTSSYEADLKKAATEAKAKADKLAGEKKYDTMREFWNLAVQVSYKKDGAWAPVTGAGNGATSIGDNLKTLLGVDSVSDADYGEKFIFSVPEDEVIVWVYREATSDEDQSPKYHYVTIDYDIEFPITASNGEDGYYYLSVEDALKDVEELGLKEVTVNEETTVSEDVVIPEGLKINVSEGKKLTFNGNVTLAKGATLSGNVDFGEGKEVSYAVTVDTTKNGTVTVDKEVAKEGEVVTVKTTAKKGYKLDKLVVKTQDGKELKVTDGKFTMVASQVTVTATFVVENPDTADNIMTYVGIATMSTMAILGAALYLNKKSYN